VRLVLVYSFKQGIDYEESGCSHRRELLKIIIY